MTNIFFEEEVTENDLFFLCYMRFLFGSGWRFCFY